MNSIIIIIIIIILIGAGIGAALALTKKKEEPRTTTANSKYFTLNFTDSSEISGTIYTWSDNMKDTIELAATKWNDVVTSIPGNDPERKIVINLTFQDFPGNTLAATFSPSTEQLNGLTYSVSGKISFDIDFYDTKWNVQSINTNSDLYRVFVHELGHLVGIGSLWAVNGLLTTIGSDILYTGVNAKNIYNYYDANDDPLFIDNVDTHYTNSTFPGVSNCLGIPVEDNGGSGTAGVHPEEGDEISFSTNDRTINGVFYPGLGDELMTGIAESVGTSMPFSAISLGFLKDLGYGVNYSNAEPYALGTGATF